MLKQFVLISAVAALPFCSSAADKVKALPVKDSEIKLDGVLDEAVWKNAPRQGGFTRLRYAEIKSAEETFFQVAASEKGLYWAFDVKDKNNISTITQYDASISREDVIELFITADDPIPDDPNVHNCRQLIFNAIGTRADLAHQSGVQNSKWNSDWRVAVKKYDGGFRAELFLPYYALNIVNRQTKNFHFNVARENTLDGKRELSVWQPTGKFADLTRFAALELPFTDFSAYQWKTGSLELKTIPTANGTAQVLTGSISGQQNGVITVQATARRNGKIAAFNRINIKAASGANSAFTLPMDLGSSGEYYVTVTGRNKTGKLFHHVEKLTLEAVPFKLKVNHPVYRKSFFPDQPDKTLSVSVDYQSDAKLLTNVKTAFTVTDQAGKVVASGEKTSGSVRTFTADGSKWLPGKYTITVKSEGPEALRGTLQETISVIAPHAKGNTVRLGKAREMILNGKPFFPRGFLGTDNHNARFFKEMGEAGYNVIHCYTLNQRTPEQIKFILDEAHKYNLKVYFYPYANCSIGFGGFRDRTVKNSKFAPRMTPQAWERLKKLVNTVKEHPAFLAWYLADEPKGAEFCAELRNVYQLLKEIDPHHPVIHLDFTAEGCISKREGYADLHILDMYPHPLVDGSWQRSISSVMYSMKLVNESVAPYGTWFCPEAFKPRGKKNRSLTYREIRCIVFGSIVNGATGIVPYKIGDPDEKYYQHIRNSGIFVSPEMHLGYLKGIGPELKGLEKVLLEPARLDVKTSTHYIIAMRKKHNNKEFITAVNTMPDTMDCTVSAKGMPNGKYRVLGENRTVEVKNGKLTDKFIGYATHIYTNDDKFTAPVDVTALEQEIKKVDDAARAALKK